MGAKFGPANPADNIHVLLEHFARERLPKHCFRGQNRAYPHNAPSAVRPATETTDATIRWVPISPHYTNAATQRDQARYDLRVVMMNFWGPAVGNLLCQQYGVTSEAFDITSDLEIAAFFATRKYPTYRPLLPAETTAPGVIYRMTIADQPGLDLEMANFTLNAYGYFENDAGHWIYFGEPIRPGPMMRYAARRGRPLVLDDFTKRLRPPVCSRNLMKVEACLRYDQIETLIRENLKQRALPDPGINFRETRTARQAGGIYFPSFRHDALVSKEPDLQKMDRSRFLATPPLAILERTTHVQEMLSFRTIEPFYFRHDPAFTIDRFTLSLLWPGKLDDPIYAAICEFAEEHCREYLDSAGVAADDLARGVIDPGYSI